MMNSEQVTFENTNGVGELSCSVCGHRETMLSFTHGNGHQLGFQCTSCHQLVAVENGLEKPTPPCSCGGVLSREESIKCPACKGEQVTFSSHYMT